jgi:hypothetical protein
MNWYAKMHKYASIIGYHATRSQFDQFDISFAKDSLGMQMREGFGYNKFYFTRDKNRATPQVGKNKIILITAELNVSKLFDGKQYTEMIRNLTTKGLSRPQAIDKLDTQLKNNGYDGIDGGWQIAVFDPSKIKIINKENI